MAPRCCRTGASARFAAPVAVFVDCGEVYIPQPEPLKIKGFGNFVLGIWDPETARSGRGRNVSGLRKNRTGTGRRIAETAR